MLALCCGGVVSDGMLLPCVVLCWVWVFFVVRCVRCGCFVLCEGCVNVVMFVLLC